MKVAVKAKRDDLIMMDNLIRLKEREVEDLQTEVNSARSGKLKQSPASVTETCKPTRLSQTASQPDMALGQTAPRTLDECSTLSTTTMSEIKVNQTSQKLFPPAPTSLHLKPLAALMNKQHLPRSDVLNNFPRREKSTSPVFKPVNKKVPI